MSRTPGGLQGDYDDDPDRFAANQLATARYSRAGDVHPVVADRLAQSPDVRLVADVGGGNGTLAAALAERGVRAVVLDPARYAGQAPVPAVRADARRLPLRDGSVDAVACLWMLYHLDDPSVAIREAARVLRPGGWFVAATSARTNDPELAHVLPGWGEPTSFDAEDAPRLVADVLGPVDVLRWDEPMIHLPDRDAAELFLRGRGLGPAPARDGAAAVHLPLDVTKRGALVWARASR